MKINRKLALLFWGIMYLVYLAITVTITSLTQAFLMTTLLLGASIFQVYFNLLLLIPRFLEKKKYLLYGVTSALLIVSVAFIRMILHVDVLNESDFSLLNKLNTNEIKWLWLLVMTIVHGGIHMLVVIFKMIVEWEESQRIKSEMKSHQLEAELKLLRLQLNPHFLFNTLNNIYTLAYLKKDNAAPMIMKLSESMRYMLSEANHKEVPLEREVNFLKNYLELNSLKSTQFSKIEMECKGVKGYHFIAPLLLISFLENIIKHSDLETNPSGWASISLLVDEEDVLHLTAENSKEPKAQNLVSTGIGLSNIKKRLALMYPDHVLEIDETQEKFLIHLTLKLTAHELHYSG